MSVTGPLCVHTADYYELVRSIACRSGNCTKWLCFLHRHCHCGYLHRRKKWVLEEGLVFGDENFYSGDPAYTLQCWT